MSKVRSAVVLTGSALAAVVAVDAAQAAQWSFSGVIGGGGSRNGPPGGYAGWVRDTATGGGGYLLGFCSTTHGGCNWTSCTAGGASCVGGSNGLSGNVKPYAINQTGHNQTHSIWAPSI